MVAVSKKTMIPWMYKNELLVETPKGALGFVYEITNVITGKKYIGKKNFLSKTKKAFKKLDGTIAKNKKVTIKESNWKYYTSSSNVIADKIDDSKTRLGGEWLLEWEFEILSINSNLSENNYQELRLQVMKDTLDAQMCTLCFGERELSSNSDNCKCGGEWTHRYDNGNIDRVYYKTADEVLWKARKVSFLEMLN